MISNNKQLLVLVAVWIVSCASIVDALANRKPFPIAPPVTASVYAETLPTLFTSNLVYDFADVVKGVRDEDFVVKSPESFPIQDWSVYKGASLDFSDINKGKGLSLSQIYDFLSHNTAAMELICKDCVQDLKNYFESPCGCNNESGGGPASEVYLTCFRSIQREVSCVYGIINDTCKKQVMVVFRGSAFEGRDWRTNANARLVQMTTPSLVADKMNGKLKERVLVHGGFYGYLFDNENIEREQRYKRILKDIEPLFEEGYSLYITGHSLGGALANMLSFQIAGAGEEAAFVPRPVNCITFAAPMSGTSGFRAAYEQMEQDKLLRSLRVNNREDLVPSLFPISTGVGKRRLFKHTGMNLRLKKRGRGILIEHSSKAGVATAVRNNVLGKRIVGSFAFKSYHLLPSHLKRIKRRQEALEATTLDELYQDTSHVGNYFHEGKMYKESKDEE